MKRRKTLRISILLLIATVGLVFVQIRCRHDGIDVTTLDKVCYERDIAPIFLRSCATTGCHDQQTSEGGYSFTDYNSVMKAITPFDAQKSTAYKAITGKGFMQLMPPAGALSQNERILIRVWIDQGAVNDPACIPSVGGINPVVAHSEKVCFQRDILPVLISSCCISATATTPGYHDLTTPKEDYIITSCELRKIELWKANGATQN